MCGFGFICIISSRPGTNKILCLEMKKKQQLNFQLDRIEKQVAINSIQNSHKYADNEY